MLAYQLFALTPPLPSSRDAAMPIFGSSQHRGIGAQGAATSSPTEVFPVHSGIIGQIRMKAVFLIMMLLPQLPQD
jgi:hypothetical protein